MRIRIPRRFLLLGVLLCSLALATSVPQPTYAKPIPWNDENGPAPSGDGDGPVVKVSGGSSGSITTLNAASTETVRTASTWSVWKAYLTALRLGYGWRWFW